MPFLHGVANSGSLLALRSVLGYSYSIRATIFTGVPPDVHNQWSKFRYDPAGSPFRQWPWLRALDFIPTTAARSAARFLTSRYLLNRLGRPKYKGLGTENVPYDVLVDFDFSEVDIEAPHSLPVPTFFDVMRENGLSWSHLETPLYEPYLSPPILREAVKASDVVIVYTPVLDAIAHRTGLRSVRFIRALREVDELCRKVSTEVGERVPLVVFSDHGMNDVHTTIRISRKDLVDGAEVFVDSTMIRSWGENTGAILNRELPGRFLHTEERKEYGIAFRDESYGREIFLLEPGYAFYPAYVSWLRPRAMHGYDPRVPSQYAGFVSNRAPLSGSSTTSPSVLDLMPTFLRLMEIRPPEFCVGRPLLG